MWRTYTSSFAIFPKLVPLMAFLYLSRKRVKRWIRCDLPLDSQLMSCIENYGMFWERESDRWVEQFSLPSNYVFFIPSIERHHHYHHHFLSLSLSSHQWWSISPFPSNQENRNLLSLNFETFFLQQPVQPFSWFIPNLLITDSLLIFHWISSFDLLTKSSHEFGIIHEILSLPYSIHQIYIQKYDHLTIMKMFL